jgi:glycosyltransferase involved in cell wall biosynthesis
MDRSRVAIVIPAYNEADTISRVIDNVRTFGVPVVVDDGSDDKTAAKAALAGADVVRLSSNSGYDRALNAGFDRAEKLGCDFIITMDADGQHEPSSLPAFIEALEVGAEISVGIRKSRQRAGEIIFSWFSFALWGVVDPLCGMKGYRTSLYRELGHFDSYGSIGTELLIFAARANRRITNLQIKTYIRQDSPRFGNCLSANYLILRALLLGILCKKNKRTYI